MKKLIFPEARFALKPANAFLLSSTDKLTDPEILYFYKIKIKLKNTICGVLLMLDASLSFECLVREEL